MIALNYAEYLKLDRLMSLQQTRTPAGIDNRVRVSENFFIVAHQCCELWLSQALLDLDAATTALSTSDRNREVALEHLHRVAAVLRILGEHVTVLNKLPAACFAEFRPLLGTASGAQSSQFHALDLRLGTGRRPSAITEAFVATVRADGLDLVAVCRHDLAAGALHALAEALLDIGQAYWTWKVAHLALVARLLGDQSGTAGSAGFDYLVRRVVMPFPELRAARQRAHLRSGSESCPAAS